MTILCRGCNNPITEENDSKAHIIPNALGGRLAPKGIICKTCNSILDRKADNALIKAFSAWPTLLDIPLQRGSNSPMTIETRNGRKVRAEADGSLVYTHVKYDVSDIPDGNLVKIEAGNMKTFNQLLKRAAKEYPKFDLAEAKQCVRTVGIQDDDIKLSLDFSPAAVFGGVITAIWLYLIMKTDQVLMDWDRLLHCIYEMQNHGGTFRYFIDGLPGLYGPNIDIGHKIIVRAIPSTGELIAYVEILGILKVGGLFAKSQTFNCEFEHIYAYDLVQQADRSSEYSIDRDEFDRQDWPSIGLAPIKNNAESLCNYVNDACNVLTNHYRQRLSK